MSKRTRRKRWGARRRAKEREQAARVTRVLLGEFAIGDHVQAIPKRYFPNMQTARGWITRVIELDTNGHYPGNKAYEITLDATSNTNMNNRRTFWAAEDMLTHIGDTQ